MSDIAGSVGFEITADGSDLSAQIAAAVNSALSDAMAAANIVGDDVGAALGNAIAEALAAAAAQISSTASSVGSDVTGALTVGVGGAVEGVTEQLSLFGDEAASAFGSVADAAGGVVTVISEELGGAFVGTQDEVDAAMAEAASALGLLGSAVTDAAATVTDQLPGAFVDANERIRDENGRFVADVDSSTRDAAQKASENTQTGAQGMVDATQAATVQMGQLIGAVFAGNELSKGFDTLVAGVGDAISALPSLGAEIQGSFNTIRVATGDTGAALAGLKDDFNAVAGRTPAGLDQVGQAIAVINQRLGSTGPNLQELSLGFLRFSSLTGTDLNANLQTITGAFNNFNIAADQQTGKLDELFRVYQATGVPVGTLTSAMSSLGPIARQLGLSFEDTASLVGNLNKAGLDAGTIQMGLTKIMKKATDDHVSAQTELTNVFSGIKSGIIAQSQAMDIFGPRGARLFDLIRSGTLDYQGLSAAISSGGDTLAQAAVDTSTWQGQLAILGNQLKVVLEPIATFVFTQITNAVRAVRPVVVEVANVVMSLLAPAWQALLSVLLPLWNLLDRVRQGFDAFVSTFDDSTVPAIDLVAGAISNFVEILTGSADAGSAAGDWVQNLITTFTDLWTQLQPVRDFIGNLFDTIRTAIGDFIAANPVPVLIGLATVIGGVLLSAFAALAGVVISLLAPVAAFVAGIIAVPLALGLVVAALVAAYNNFQGFHDAVNSAITGVVGFVTGTLVPAFLELKDTVVAALEPVGASLSHMWDVLGGGQGILQWLSDHWQILAGVVLAVVSPVGALVAAFVLAYAKLEPFRALINGIIGVLGDLIGDVVNAVSGIIEIIQGLASGDWDKAKQGIVDFASSILAALTDVLSQLPDLILNALTAVTDAVLGALSNIPVLGNLFDGLKTIIDGVATTLSGLFEIVTGILTLNWDQIKDGLGNALGGIRDALAGFFGGIGGFIADLLRAALPAAWAAIKAGVPALLEAFGTLLSNLPGWLLTALGALGQVVVAGLTAAWQFLVDNGPTVLAAVATWLAGLPGMILGWLGDLGSLLLGWLGSALSFLVSGAGAVLGGVIGFFADLPAMFFNSLMDSVAFIVNFVAEAVLWAVQNLPGIISGIVDFFRSIPGRLWEAVGDFGGFLVNKYLEAVTWLVNNLPGIISGILDFFRSLPGRLWDAVGALGGFLVEKLQEAFSWLVQNLPGMIQGVVDFFASIPGRLFDAIKSGIGAAGGAITDLAKTLFNSIADFVNQHLIDPIKNHTFSILGQDYTPFGFLPDLPKFARGAIVNQATLGVFGEAGREALVPLDDPTRGAAVARAAGIPQILAANGGSSGGGDTYVTYVTVSVDPSMSPQDTADHVNAATAAAEDSDRRKRIAAEFKAA